MRGRTFTEILPIQPTRLRLAALIAVSVIGVVLAIPSVAYVVSNSDAPDRTFFLEAARRALNGIDLYTNWSASYQFRWSPVSAVLLAAVLPLGLTVWRLAQFGAVLTLRAAGWRWSSVLLVLATWPFWFDVQTANVLVFTFVLAVWALRGSAGATWAYLALFVLIPRPLALPVCVWLLWKRPVWRIRFAALVALSIVGVALMNGWGWIAAMTATLPSETYTNPLNLGPSRWIGFWWIPIGLALAVFFTWTGELGAASLAASPYLLPYYLLMGLVRAPENVRRNATFGPGVLPAGFRRRPRGRALAMESRVRSGRPEEVGDDPEQHRDEKQVP